MSVVPVLIGLPATASRSVVLPASRPAQQQQQQQRCHTILRSTAHSGETVMTEEPRTTTQDIIFNPAREGAADMAVVESAEMNVTEDSLARLDMFSDEAEAAINEQINHEYTMSYVYHQMSSYFNRDNVALPGLRDFYKASSLEERSHAQQLMDYQATRGGRVKLATLMAPETDYNHPDKGDALHSMEVALALERLNLEYLYRLHDVAERAKDAQFADYVETMMEEQVSGVKEISDYVTKLRRVGKGLGVYQFDQEIAARAPSMAAEATAIITPTAAP